MKPLLTAASLAVLRAVTGLLVSLAVPARADTPPAPAQAAFQKIFLHYLDPTEVLQALHWDKDLPSRDKSQRNGFAYSLPGQPALTTPIPDGVVHLYSIEGDNSILLLATSDGYAHVKALLQSLDVAITKVRIKTIFVSIATADADKLDIPVILLPTADDIPAGFISGTGAAQLYTLLTKTKSRLNAVPLVTTRPDLPVAIDRDEDPLTAQNVNMQFEMVNRAITVWPHINIDSSVTLAVDVPMDNGNLYVEPPAKTGRWAQPPLFAAPLVVQTVPSGDTLALRFTLPTDGAAPSQDLFIFLTPTIVDDDYAGKPAGSAPASVPPVEH